MAALSRGPGAPRACPVAQNGTANSMTESVRYCVAGRNRKLLKNLFYPQRIGLSGFEAVAAINGAKGGASQRRASDANLNSRVADIVIPPSLTLPVSSRL